jgi:hypothetical protein
VLNSVIGVEEAAEKWGLSAGYIKTLCAEGKIIAKKIGKTWVIDQTQEKPNADLSKENENTFTSKSESRFFVKSEFDYIGHEFNFKALTDMTSEEFSEQIKDIMGLNSVKTFSYEIYDQHSFKFTSMKFYAEDYEKRDFTIIKASWAEDYENIRQINKRDFDSLGMTISYK